MAKLKLFKLRDINRDRRIIHIQMQIVFSLFLLFCGTVCLNAQTDFTDKVQNPEFDDSTMTNGAPQGWLQTVGAATSRISTAAKGDGSVIVGARNHWLLWDGGGLTGKVYQVISNLPNGDYTFRAGLYATFGGTVKLYANEETANIVSGVSTYYTVSVSVTDGTLEIGLDIATSGGQTTIDFDHVTLISGRIAKKITVFPIGDGTMAEKGSGNSEKGWGTLFPIFVDADSVIVSNNGFDGRSTKSFIDEGKWTSVLNQLEAGDFVFIQFGHNDEKQEESSLYTNPATTYRTNLTKFVNETRAKGATPVLLTPIVRRNFDAFEQPINTHGAYPDAVRETAQTLNVPLIDMEEKTRLFETIAGIAGSRDVHQFNPPVEIDNTHLGLFGAYVVARMVAEGVSELNIDLPLNEDAGTLGLYVLSNTLALAKTDYLANALAAATDRLANYSGFSGSAAFSETITTIQNSYNTMDLNQLATASQALREAERTCIFSQTPPFDATLAISNAGFEEGTNYTGGIHIPLGWELKQTTGGTKDIGIKTATPAAGYYKYSVWASQVNAINLYQDIVLPAGKYTYSTMMHTSSAADVTNQHLYVILGEDSITSATLTYDDSNYWIPLTVSFTVAADNTQVRIGAASTGTGTAAGHFSVDSAGLSKTSGLTGIGTISAQDKIVGRKYYNLTGVEISGKSLQKGGIYIEKRLYLSGKTEAKKIMSF